MLALDDERWSTLEHAYGPATDIPAALARLKASPTTDDRALWEIFWSSLNHQGDVYSATFAAVPHVIDVIAMAPAAASWEAFAFIASVEVSRANRSPVVPAWLVAFYDDAWGRVPSLSAAALAAPLDELWTRCVLAALAASRQQPSLADLLLEAEGEDIPAMLDWWRNR